jgi:glycerol uptake facilitator protein
VIDQNAKLAVFATRPAIPSPLLNFIVEFLGTLFLIMGADLIGFQSSFLYFPVAGLWGPLTAWFVGWYIFLLVLGLGGPTGVGKVCLSVSETNQQCPSWFGPHFPSGFR